MRKKKPWKNLYYLKTRYLLGKKKKITSGYYERVSSLEVRIVLDLKEWHFSIKADHYYIFVVSGSDSSRSSSRSGSCSSSSSSIFSHNI